MTKKYFSNLTPLEKAEHKAYNFAFNLYESLLVSVYMTSGSLEIPGDIFLTGSFYPSGSQSSSEQQAA